MRYLKVVLAVTLLLAVTLYLWGSYQLEQSSRDPEQYDAYLAAPAEDAARIINPASRQACNDHNPRRNAYFGDLHIHTSLSHDSAAWGNATRPSDAYDFARGAPLALRLRGEALADTPVIQLDRPLDFAAVTDHAERFGETRLCLTPGNNAYDSWICSVYRGDTVLPAAESMQPLVRLATMVMSPYRYSRVCGDDGMDCLRESSRIWQEVQEAAELAYDQTADCAFTSFVGYEYSLAEEASNLHRNIIFANATVPPNPLSSLEAPRPEGLWEWLKSSCIDTDSGCDALAIPHNSNWSSGRMFYPYALSDLPDSEKQRFARLRSELEPLVEIMQVKGDSECRNGLSRVLGEPDELCDFEKLRVPNEVAEDCEDGYGSGGMRLTGCLSRWSYARYGLAEGLNEQRELGINPMKFGIIASTDNHTSTGGAVLESQFPGSTGIDTTPLTRLREPVETPFAKADPTRFNPGGLTGIWAQENTRASLFSAMKRKETFGTSGPRIQPRLFASWDFPDSLCDDPQRIETAYASGVPMGGDLSAPPRQDSQPTFMLSAMMDGSTNATPLQKLQVIKVWTDPEGTIHQQVVDVAGDAQPTMITDPNTCTSTGSGHASLCTVWRDANFNPAISSIYYARVIENPSCRWTTYDCNTLPLEDRPAVCDSRTLPKTVQERAWTSPVWYTGPGTN